MINEPKIAKINEAKPRESKLDPRIKRTRQLLLQALADLLKEKDFSDITVQDISTRAEVNRATFYAHFEDKYALMNYRVQEDLQARLDSKLPDAPTLTAANLRLLVIIVCEYLGEFMGHCTPIPQNHDQMIFMVSQVQRSIYDLLLTWIAEPSSYSHQNHEYHGSPEAIARMISWVIFGIVFEWARGDRKLSLEPLTDQGLALLLSGVQSYLVPA
ncbi:MAG: TetR/AcrR family transcriptional regulator [Chloroflexota bacterium]